MLSEEGRGRSATAGQKHSSNERQPQKKDRERNNGTAEQTETATPERNIGIVRATTDWSEMDMILIRQLEDIASRALEGVAKGTRKVMSTHLSAWRRFCRTVGVDEETFGAIGKECEEVTLSQIGREVDTLELFAAYIVCYPECKKER